MKPARIRRSREELQKEAEANFAFYGNEDMKSGIHTHYCPFCKADKACPQITHCSRPDTSICFEEHRRSALEQFAKEEGLWDGKPKLPCHVPNCNDSSCDRFHPGDDE